MADARPASDVQRALASPSWLTPRLASRALYSAAATLVASMIAISLFFGGAGAFWGPVNDLLVVATVLLLLPAVAVLPGQVRPMIGTWFSVLSAAAGVGVVVIATGQVALVAGLITLDISFLTGGIGVLPILAWIGGTVAPSLGTSLLGRATGIWAVAFLTLVGLTAVVLATLTTDTPTLTGALGVPLMVALLGWLISLGRGIARVSQR